MFSEVPLEQLPVPVNSAGCSSEPCVRELGESRISLIWNCQSLPFPICQDKHRYVVYFYFLIFFHLKSFCVPKCLLHVCSALLDPSLPPCLCLLCHQAPPEDLEVGDLQGGQAVIGCKSLSDYYIRDWGRKHRDCAQIGDKMLCSIQRFEFSRWRAV